MLTKVKGIVISKINYNENSVIAKIYTNKFGLQSYMVNGIKSNKGNIKQSHLMPLNLLELEVYYQQNKSINRIKELKCFPVLNTLHFNIVKSSIALFVSEIIFKTIKEDNISDIPMFDFLYNTVLIIDETVERTANFPLFFMLKLSAFLGFEPKKNYTPLRNVFSLSDAAFISENNVDPTACAKETSKIIYELMMLDFSNFWSNHYTAEQRADVLNSIIKFYEMHDIKLGNLNSYKILKQVFN